MPRTADQPAPARSDSGLDLATLAITAASSAAAAYVCSKIWAPGTLASAAMTPVVIALLKEALRKPTAVVTSAVPVPSLRGSTTRTRAIRPDELDRTLEDGPPAPLPPPTAAAPAGPVRVYSTKGRRLRWRLAVVTGLLGFAICVVLYTVPELITGSSAGRSGDKTTFFGGSSRDSGQRSTTSTSTSTTPAQTETQTTPTATVTTPTQTVTVTTPSTTTTPPPTVQTEPVPTPTTPAPAPAPAQPAPQQPAP